MTVDGHGDREEFSITPEEQRRIEEQVDTEIALARIKAWLEYYDRNIKPLDEMGSI